MITIHKVLQFYELDPKHIRLVRHGNKHIPVFETFLNDLPRLEAYQSFQEAGAFGKASAIAVFAPYHGTTGIFLGLWDIRGCRKLSECPLERLSLVKKHHLPECRPEDVWYDLEKNPLMDELSQRMIIQWGRSTVSWVQSKDKEVIEIRGRNSLGEFRSFREVRLAYSELRNLVEFPTENLTWVSALSSVNGVYLIQDGSSGKLYVGRAFGKRGIYGRWQDYAKKGHGGDVALRELDHTRFTFSILEITHSTVNEKWVKECENMWKEKLGTWEFGLNYPEKEKMTRTSPST